MCSSSEKSENYSTVGQDSAYINFYPHILAVPDLHRAERESLIIKNNMNEQNLLWYEYNYIISNHDRMFSIYSILSYLNSKYIMGYFTRTQKETIMTQQFLWVCLK